ncbi:MAG: DsbC family protein, partial [Pseudomonadota bacterium]|nr:DsbC family protein [Pseudomonadota bacterium]
MHGSAAALLSSLSLLVSGSAVSTGDTVHAALKERLPRTKVSGVDCSKIVGLCEVTAGSNLFYVDTSARYLVIGRIYDMQTRQDLTAARLLEMNPDMLVGGAARANAAADAPDASPPGANAPNGSLETAAS